MSILDTFRAFTEGLFSLSEGAKLYDVEPLSYPETESVTQRCIDAYKGNPSWLDPDNGIITINFARTICMEVGRLTTLGVSIEVTGGARADWLQEQIELMYYNLRKWVEYSAACGIVMLKPNGKNIDVYFPDEFAIIDATGGDITGAVFLSTGTSEDGKKVFSRYEYHWFDDAGIYHIQNICFVQNRNGGEKRRVAIEETPWNMLDEEATVPGLESPLFAPMQMPNANNHDIDAPIPVPITADALAELEGLDVAFSRFTKEIYDSKRLVLLDSDRVLPAAGNKLKQYSGSMVLARNELGLPDMVKNVWGDGANAFYQEINPALNTDVRILEMNAMLSQIGYKCGFSNGYFTFNEKASKVITATQVEADQQRTIQFVKDCRDQFERAMHTLIKALDEFADLYGLAPAGSYDATFNFGDITYSYEEDKQNWWKYVLAYKVPAWMYFVKFEGMTEEEAKAMQAEMDASQPSLFEEE